jgi:hypothetical protein
MAERMSGAASGTLTSCRGPYVLPAGVAPQRVKAGLRLGMYSVSGGTGEVVVTSLTLAT